MCALGPIRPQTTEAPSVFTGTKHFCAHFILYKAARHQNAFDPRTVVSKSGSSDKYIVLKIHSSLQQDFADSMFGHMGKEDPYFNKWMCMDGLGTLRKFSNVPARKLSI